MIYYAILEKFNSPYWVGYGDDDKILNLTDGEVFLNSLANETVPIFSDVVQRFDIGKTGSFCKVGKQENYHIVYD